MSAQLVLEKRVLMESEHSQGSGSLCLRSPRGRDRSGDSGRLPRGARLSPPDMLLCLPGKNVAGGFHIL